MKEELQIGDIVRHRASLQRMVVVGNVLGIKCSYQNPITGIFEVHEFKRIELLFEKGMRPK